MSMKNFSNSEIIERAISKAKEDLQKEEDCRIFDAIKGLLPIRPDGCLDCFDDEYWEEFTE